MNLIRTAIDRPSAVIAIVLMVVLFGFVSLQTIPIQLAPDVNRPIITVTTNWTGAAPAEIEREVTIRQEEVLKGLEGLASMVSTSKDSVGEVTLEFEISHDMGQALPLSRALLAGGVSAIEITMTTPGAIEANTCALASS